MNTLSENSLRLATSSAWVIIEKLDDGTYVYFVSDGNMKRVKSGASMEVRVVAEQVREALVAHLEKKEPTLDDELAHLKEQGIDLFDEEKK